MNNNYFDNGVLVSPREIREGDRVTVMYKGLLDRSGADSVFMCVGYGDRWDGTNYVQMSRTHEGFKAELPVTQYSKLNMVFKDSANNWDNNGGYNYSYDVYQR